MSLINDAIKRASQSEKDRPPGAGPPSAMRPAPASRRSFVPALAILAIVALLAAAGWLVWRSLSPRQNPAPLPSVTSAQASRRDAAAASNPAPPPSVAPAKQGLPEVARTNEGLAEAVPAKQGLPEVAANEGLPAVVPTNEGLPAVVTPPASTNPPAAPPATNIASAPLPPSFPELKLQGIFYNLNNPRASINGEIHRENEFIGEVRIVTIASNKVIVEWNGQTRDLNLGEP
jgi:hypothetical protein